MNGAGAAIAGTLILAVLFSPRRWALLALCCGMLYLPLAQHLVVADFALYPMRLLAVAGLLRVVARGDIGHVRWHRFDAVLLGAYAYTVAVFCARSDEEVMFRLGWGVDAAMAYLVFRSLLREMADLITLLQGLALAMLPFAALVLVESLRFDNAFLALGGVNLAAEGDTWVREGRLRALGSFGHPSLAGTFAGTFLPLYIGLHFVKPTQRIVAWLGVALCLAIVFAANSGGPFNCVAVAILAWLLWPMRRHMKVVRWSLAGGFILLALIMKAPIWYLVARISDFSGGGGYHRALLMDVAFQQLSNWWLMGMSMGETRAWLPYTNTLTGMVDLTNTYLSFGIAAGLPAMFLFIAALVVAFSCVGRTMAAMRDDQQDALAHEPLLWGVGAVLSVHIVNWFGITYWDQTSALIFLHFAIVGSLATPAAAVETEPPEADSAGVARAPVRAG